MADALFLAVRYLHILCAMLWVGAIVILNVVFFPRLARLPLGEQRTFLAAFGPAIARYGEASGVLTVTFGLLMYAYLFGIGTLVAGTAHATAYLAALGLAVLVILLGALFLFPRLKEATRLLQAMDPRGRPSPEFVRIVKPLPMVGMAAMALVAGVLGIMVAAGNGVV